MSGLNLDSHLKAFVASLHKLQEKEVMTDVTLILPDQSAIPCHKVVLMAASPFFDTMFQSGLKEGAEQNIKLDFADSDIIKILVEFFYTGDIELTAENIKALVAGSEFLCCKHLRAHCEEYLVDTVDLSNCIDYYRYGQVFNLKLLIKTAFDFLLSKFREFKEISDFNILTEDELVEVVSCDRLNAENEDVVFEAVVHWVNADPDARKEVFPRIAPLIRFPFCTQTALADKICCSSLMLKSECIQLAHEALLSQFHFNCGPPLDNARCIPRQAFHSTPSLYRLIQSNSPNIISLSVASFVDGSGIKWKTILPCITTTFARVITSPSGLYLINDNECYFVQPKLKRVTSFPWKPVNQYSALAFIDGKIFAFGDAPASKSVKSINLQELNPEWKSEQEMLHAVDMPLIVQFANKVYAFGGYQTTVVTQEFDPALNEWRMRSQMPGPCYWGCAVALGDKIYVVGGREKVELLLSEKHLRSTDLPKYRVMCQKMGLKYSAMQRFTPDSSWL
uniref:BTB domain-containing protein n=2 Tax=Capitella teleta TaxID=283909 RepID=X1ZKS3_CAPTE